MRRAARDGVAQLSPEAVVREFETLLHELAGEPDHASHALAARA
jgi:hypothetical protein